MSWCKVLTLGITDIQTKEGYRLNIKKYISRAEEIQETIKTIKENSKVWKTIKIVEDSTGHSYDTIFGSYLQETVKEIEIEDAYIRIYHQVINYTLFYLYHIYTCFPTSAHVTVICIDFFLLCTESFVSNENVFKIGLCIVFYICKSFILC